MSTSGARSLVINPKLLLLDEPLSALDAKIRKHLRQQIRSIQKELNLTVLFVTHDQEEALEMSDKIILLNQGNIEQEGDAHSIYLSPSSRFVAEFIGNYNLLSPQEYQVLTGETVNSSVAIRPESLILSADGIPATITDYAILGNVIRYKLKAGNCELQLDHFYRTEHDLLRVNQSVFFTLTEKTIIQEDRV